MGEGEVADHVSYIESFVLFGRRPFAREEAQFLQHQQRSLRKGLFRAQLLATAGSLGLLSSFVLVAVFQVYDIAAALMGFGLMAAVFGFGKIRSCRIRLRAINSELDFGEIDAYGPPPECNVVDGQPTYHEVILHSPVTKRMLWIQGNFYEHEYIAPTRVASAPPALQNLIDSDWLNEDVELHRDLTADEIKELQGHYAQRGQQVFLGYFLLIVFIVSICVSVAMRRFTPLPVFALIFGATAIPKGWVAKRQRKELAADLIHKRLTIIKETAQGGEPVVFEYLEASGVTWSANGVAAPWRGRVGA